jgi:hypothetical protein
VQTLVGRFVSGSGFVLVRQTFVLGGQAVAIRACLWLSWDRVKRQRLTAASICTPLDDWACRCLLAALPPIGVHCSLPGNIPTREAAMVRRLSEAGRGSPPINLLRK